MSEVEILLVQEPPVTPREPARQVREPRRLRATACRESALRALAGASQLEFDFKLQQAATAVVREVLGHFTTRTKTSAAHLQHVIVVNLLWASLQI